MNILYGESNGPIWIKGDVREFAGEDINGSHWNGKIKCVNEKGDIIVNGEFKNGYFIGITKGENDEEELIEKDFKRGILREGHVTDENLSFDFDEKDPYFFVGQYKKGKRWKGEGSEFYPNKRIEFKRKYDNGERVKGTEYYDDGLIKF